MQYHISHVFRASTAFKESSSDRFNPILPGGGGVKYAPLKFFLHHPKTAQGNKPKLSDFEDTLLRHILQLKPVP